MAYPQPDDERGQTPILTVFIEVFHLPEAKTNLVQVRSKGYIDVTQEMLLDLLQKATVSVRESQ